MNERELHISVKQFIQTVHVNESVQKVTIHWFKKSVLQLNTAVLQQSFDVFSVNDTSGF